MACFILKPIFWNTENYQRPSGVRGTSGFPKDWGFGHEEWNNSPRLELREGRVSSRVFHTEGIGNAPVDENVGQTFVFMYASHDGLQQLVGIAGNATWLGEDHDKERRRDLVKRLGLGELWRDAWRVDRVRQLTTLAKLRRHWAAEMHWIANWTCPSEFYWWAREPVTLNAPALLGTSKLLTMFGRYTRLNLEQASAVINSVPAEQRDGSWLRILDAMRAAPATPVTAEDLALTGGKSSITTQIAMVHARRGQGQFREDVLRLWDRACAVTGIARAEVLRASHIRPWATSNDRQRRDPANGLILCANLDALFDRGLITFSDDGELMVSRQLSDEERSQLGLRDGLRRALSPEQRRYLAHHRDRCFQP